MWISYLSSPVFALIVSTIYSSSKASSYLRPLCFDGCLKYTDHGLFYYQVFFCPYPPQKKKPLLKYPLLGTLVFCMFIWQTLDHLSTPNSSFLFCLLLFLDVVLQEALTVLEFRVQTKLASDSEICLLQLPSVGIEGTHHYTQLVCFVSWFWLPYLHPRLNTIRFTRL